MGNELSETSFCMWQLLFKYNFTDFMCLMKIQAIDFSSIKLVANHNRSVLGGKFKIYLYRSDSIIRELHKKITPYNRTIFIFLIFSVFLLEISPGTSFWRFPQKIYLGIGIQAFHLSITLKIPWIAPKSHPTIYSYRNLGIPADSFVDFFWLFFQGIFRSSFKDSHGSLIW